MGRKFGEEIAELLSPNRPERQSGLLFAASDVAGCVSAASMVGCRADIRTKLRCHIRGGGGAGSSYLTSVLPCALPGICSSQ